MVGGGGESKGGLAQGGMRISRLFVYIDCTLGLRGTEMADRFIDTIHRCKKTPVILGKIGGAYTVAPKVDTLQHRDVLVW